MSRIAAGVVAALAVLYLLLPADPTAVPSCTDFLELCSKDLKSATATTNQFAVWRRASPLANITSDPPSLLDKLRMKEWNYVSVSSERYFFAFALVRFSYVSDVFVYVVDKTNPVKYEYTARLPLGIGVDIAPSSLQGCSKWGHPPKRDDVVETAPWIQLCAKVEGGFRVRMSVPLWGPDGAKSSLKTEYEFADTSDDQLAMVFPLGARTDRRAYTHKAAAQVNRGWLEIGSGARIGLEGAAAGLDWTRSLCLRTTRWRWASIHDTTATSSGKPVRHLAINLSQFVYDVAPSLDPTKRVSVENIVFVNGRAIRFLHPIVIAMPANGSAQWTIRSAAETSDEMVDISFTPHGQREDHSHFGLAVSDFTQPFGVFAGSFRIFSYSIGRHLTITFGPGAYGVVEDHHAVW